jgi:hypothetical protein
MSSLGLARTRAATMKPAPLRMRESALRLWASLSNRTQPPLPQREICLVCICVRSLDALQWHPLFSGGKPHLALAGTVPSMPKARDLVRTCVCASRPCVGLRLLGRGVRGCGGAFCFFSRWKRPMGGQTKPARNLHSSSIGGGGRRNACDCIADSETSRPSARSR